MKLERRNKKSPNHFGFGLFRFWRNGGKPKGMHWTTYHRLKNEHDALVQVSLHDLGLKLGFLHKLLDG